MHVALLFALPLAMAQDPSGSAAENPATPPESAPAESPEQPTGPADPDVLPPQDEAENPGTTQAELERLYLDAYADWQRGRWTEAQNKVEAVLAIDPAFRPARLLLGYCLIRRDRQEEGMAVLDALVAEEPTTPYEEAIRSRASLLLGRYRDKMRRDQIALVMGTEGLVERRLDGVAFRLGAAVQLDVPIRDVLGIRAEWSGAVPASNSFGGELVVDGHHFALMARATLPIGRGLWSVEGAVGPAIWLATGRHWPDGNEPFVGVRTALGSDWRFSRRVGLRMEAGWSFWPGQQAELPWLGQNLDSRVAMVVWMGR
jgi:Tetratricopeptide repeat